MAAYVISEVEMLDETQGRRYRELAAGSIARHGGRYLVRGAAPVVAEGDWSASCRIVVVEFNSMERLQAWYTSADYAEALAVRQTALDRRLLFVDGAHISPGLGWPDLRCHAVPESARAPHYTPVVAGISVAFTSPAGISAEASGAASADGTPLTPESMFQAGSVSKAVTGYAAHRLAAEGRLDLDADVNAILTSWQLPRVREWRPGVTVRDLLAHMAGVSGSWGEGTARDEPVPGLLEILAGTTAAAPVAFEALPGLTWSYSGGGYLVVAQVICDVTGLAFAEAMAELVLEPAGMTASTFRQQLPSSLEPTAAWGHHGGEPVPGGWRNQPDTGAVGLWATPSDLVRFARAVSADRSVDMLNPHPAEPRMGSGVFLATSDRGVRWWSHSGLVTGYASLLACTGGFAVAIMSNDSQAEDLIGELFRDIAVSRGPGPVELTNLFGESIRRWIEMTARQDRFVGTYVLPWGAEVHVTAPMGQHAPELRLTLPGHPPVRLLPATPHRWYVPGIAGTDIAFIPPDSLRISQHGRQLDARRAQAP